MTAAKISGWVSLLRAWGLFWLMACSTLAGILQFGTVGFDTPPSQGNLWQMGSEARFLTSLALCVFAVSAAAPAICTFWRSAIGYVLTLIVLLLALMMGILLLEASRLTVADMGCGVLVIELAVFVTRPVREFIFYTE